MDLESLARIDQGSLRKLVPPSTAIDAIERALRAGLNPELAHPRSRVDTNNGQLLLMPADDLQWVGLKSITFAPGNPVAGRPLIQGVYVLYSADTLEAVALLDGAALTTVRTPAVSALAVKYLSNPAASRVIVFGSGPQAFGHLDAICAVLPIKSVGVVTRSRASAEGLVRYGIERHQLEAAHATPADVADADLVVCCTTSSEPLYSGLDLPDDVVVVAVGSHDPEKTEVDSVTVARSQIFVESRVSAVQEAGELAQGIRAGTLAIESMTNIAELVEGAVVDMSRPRLFKSVGMGWEDMAVAGAAYELAGRRDERASVE